jgi:hypothetical protein
MEVSVFIKETHFAQLFRFLAHNSGLPCLILTRFSPLKRLALQMLDDILPFLDFNTLLQSRSCSKATCWSVEQIKTFEDRYAEMLQKMNMVPDEVEDNHSVILKKNASCPNKQKKSVELEADPSRVVGSRPRNDREVA